MHILCMYLAQLLEHKSNVQKVVHWTPVGISDFSLLCSPCLGQTEHDIPIRNDSVNVCIILNNGAH